MCTLWQFFMGLFGKKKEEGEEPEEEEEQEYDTYTALVECENCKEENEIEIPVKTLVKDFIKNKKCELCECNLIQTEVK